MADYKAPRPTRKAALTNDGDRGRLRHGPCDAALGTMIEIYAQSYNGQPASADLRCVFGPDGGTFGRGSDNRLPLPDPARHVSRVQGRVRWDGARYWIANTSDANPMFLNDEELEARRERPLAAGDEIRVGLYVLRVREAADAGIQYRPPPSVQRPAPPPPPPAGIAAAPRAPIHQASIDGLVGGALTTDNPFADLIGGAAAAPAPVAPPRPAPPASDPFADLLGASAPSPAPPVVAAAAAPVNAADPFGDLLGSPSPSAPATSARAPTPAAPAFPQGSIPDDFDPFSAKPSADAMRNTDDPLRALAENAVDLGGVAPAAQPLSLVDFEPRVTRDPLEALGGTPSLVDPHEAVDPLQIFGGDDGKLVGGGNEVIPAGALPMDDGLPLLDGPFVPGRSIPDPLAPVEAYAPVAEPSPAPPPEPLLPPGPPPPPQPPPMPEADATRIAPPPVAPAPPRSMERVVPVAPPAAPPADMKRLVDAFLEGAGVPEGTLARELTPEAMRELGTLVREAVAGAMSLIAVRQITKREIGAELTMIVATRNNPLKFLPTPEAAMMQILGPRMPGFMAPVDSMADAFEDLRAHEVGVIAGTRAAFTEVLRRFDPKELEQRLGKGGLLDGILPGHRDAKLWELFVARFQEVYKDAQDDFDSLYGLAFTQAYEAEVRRARAARRS
jgi:FHA domain-containing protein